MKKTRNSVFRRFSKKAILAARRDSVTHRAIIYLTDFTRLNLFEV